MVFGVTLRQVRLAILQLVEYGRIGDDPAMAGNIFVKTASSDDT
jgi:hypothetical protein